MYANRDLPNAPTSPSASPIFHTVCRTWSAAVKSYSGSSASTRVIHELISGRSRYARKTGPLCAFVAVMCRVRSSSGTLRVFSCFLMMSFS